MIEATFFKLANSSPAISWLITILGTLILISPITVGWWLTNKYNFRWRKTVTFFLFGIMALPTFIWFFLHYFLDSKRTILGGIGIFILPLHAHLLQLVSINALEPIVLDTKVFSIDFILGCFIWAIVYGLIGFASDHKRIKNISKRLKERSPKKL